jgi:hypothetical protein
MIAVAAAAMIRAARTAMHRAANRVPSRASGTKARVVKAARAATVVAKAELQAAPAWPPATARRTLSRRNRVVKNPETIARDKVIVTRLLRVAMCLR